MDIQQRKLLLIIIGIIASFVIISLIVAAILHNNTSPYGSELKIESFSKTIQNLPEDRRQAIQSMLLVTVQKNNDSNIDPSAISAGVIRSGSESQEYIEDLDYYKGYFIVDIESIRQSYGVEYHYKKEADSFVTGGNTVIISCLPADKLIYGQFNCTDILSEQSKGVDPLVKDLPYHSTFFKVSGYYVGNKLQLKVELRIPSPELNSDKVSAVAKYKEKARHWIRTTGNDPDSYIINYNYSDIGEKIELP